MVVLALIKKNPATQAEAVVRSFYMNSYALVLLTVYTCKQEVQRLSVFSFQMRRRVHNGAFQSRSRCNTPPSQHSSLCIAVARALVAPHACYMT